MHSCNQHPPHSFPKLNGADIELGNFILGHSQSQSTYRQASEALLAEIQGIPYSAILSLCSYGSNLSPEYGESCRSDSNMNLTDVSTSEFHSNHDSGYNAQDRGRKFLASNGGCVYIDLNHLEVCIPECISAYDHLAAWHAMLRIVREAMIQANHRLPKGQKIQVLINNSDGHGNSYGSHLDFLISRRCFDNLFSHKLHQMLYLASYQISGIVFSGAGKVGSENDRPAVDYQISQRADFYETLVGTQTTHNRPIINSRDESLCGSLGKPSPADPNESPMARLHVIFFDNTLCHTSSLLKVGVTQIILAMIEQGYIQPGVLLDNPLSALLRWSHDPTLRQKTRILCGKDYTAVEVQMALADLAGRFISAGKAQDIVPHANQIFTLWTETLEQLKQRDFPALVGKLDWVLKHSILEQAIRNNELTWKSPQIKYLDQMYANLDSAERLYWAMERAGITPKLVTDAQVERFIHQPPSDTRAYLRAQILRRIDADSIVNIDWDSIRLRYGPRNHYWSCYSYLDLPMYNPFGFTKIEFDQAMDRANTFQEVLRGMGVQETSHLDQPGSVPYGTQNHNVPLMSAGSYWIKSNDQSEDICNSDITGYPFINDKRTKGEQNHGNAPTTPRVSRPSGNAN